MSSAQDQEVFSLKGFPKWLSNKTKHILWESNKLFEQRQEVGEHVK